MEREKKKKKKGEERGSTRLSTWQRRSPHQPLMLLSHLLLLLWVGLLVISSFSFFYIFLHLNKLCLELGQLFIIVIIWGAVWVSRKVRKLVYLFICYKVGEMFSLILDNLNYHKKKKKRLWKKFLNLKIKRILGQYFLFNFSSSSSLSRSKPFYCVWF